MTDFDPEQNEKDSKRMLWTIGGVVLLSVAVTVFLIFNKVAKNNSNTKLLKDPESSDLVLPDKSQPTAQTPQALYSSDINTWKDYHWPGKINTHYPGDWILKENTSTSGMIDGLAIVPPTNNTDDVIFIGGKGITCSVAAKYPKNTCLKDKIQMPFFTNSSNPEVASAFDLIVANTILTTDEK